MPNSGVITMSLMRSRARERSDMVTSQFVTDAEFDGYLAESLAELYGVLILSFGNDYYTAGTPDNWYQFTTTATAGGYALPDGSATYKLVDTTTIAPAFFKLLGVDAKPGNDWVPLKPFTFADRNRYSSSTATGVLPRYRLTGNNLWLTPQPQAGWPIRIWYTPRVPVLVGSSTITFVAIDAAAAPNPVLTVNGVTLTGGGVDWAVGATTTTAATNLAAAFTAAKLSSMGLSDATVTASGPVVTITLSASTQTIVWSFTNTGTNMVALFPGTTGPALGSSNGTYQNYFDGVSGWEEYAIVDAAIKALVKEESSATELAVAKAGLLTRITEEASARDIGSPPMVSDVRPWAWSTAPDDDDSALRWR